MYFNPREDTSFRLSVYGKGSTIRDPSLVYLYFTDDGDDIDDEKGYSLFLADNSAVALSVGDAYHAQTKTVQVLIHSFEFGLPRVAIDAVANGGVVTIQLPKGKRYVSKLPASQAAMTRFKQCFGG